MSLLENPARQSSSDPQRLKPLVWRVLTAWLKPCPFKALRGANLIRVSLVLLCYKKGVPQKGQPESCRSRTRAMVLRRVAIDQGLCRATRTGRAPRAELGRHFGDG